MTLSLINSRALLGLQTPAVTVEVHLANGLPSFTLVGLADTEVKEARERVRCAIQTAVGQIWIQFNSHDKALTRQGTPNQALQGQALEVHMQLDASTAMFLQNAAAKLGWSRRSTHRALHVARTIRPCRQHHGASGQRGRGAAIPTRVGKPLSRVRNTRS